MSTEHSPLPEDDPRPRPPWIYTTLQKVEAPLTDIVGLSCRQFARLTVTRMDRALSRNEEMRYRIHGAFCGLCSKFAAQFTHINDLTKEIEAETSATAGSDPAAITRIAGAVRAAVGDGGKKAP